MRQKGSGRRLAVALAATLLLGAGCVRVTPIDPFPAATPVAAVVDQFDVAVLSVDVESTDQDALSLNASSDVGLVAVVDNRGREPVTDLVVTARIAGPSEDSTIIEARETIRILAPGEAKVVRFSQKLTPPSLQTYWVSVLAQPVPGEVSLSNNRRALRLDIALP